MGTQVTIDTVLGYNGTFWREDTAGGDIFTEIADVVSVKWDGVSRNVGSASVLTSLTKQGHAGLPDLGNLQVVLRYDPSNTAIDDLETDAQAAIGSTGRAYAVGVNSATPQYRKFTGILVGFEPSSLEAENDDQLTVALTIKVNSMDAWSATAPSTA
jgi:hypothetical protein